MKIYLYLCGDGSCPIELDSENISFLYLGGEPYLVVYNPVPVIEELHKKGYWWKAECDDNGMSTKIQLEEYEWSISFNWETAKRYSRWEEETEIGEN